MPQLEIDGNKVAYSLDLSRQRRSVAIIIDPERGVIVKAPHRLGGRELRSILEQRKDWIRAKLDKIARYKTPPRTFVEGEQFLFLGQGYTLKVTASPKNLVYLLNDELCIEHNGRRELKHHLSRWYLDQAERIIRERVALYSERLGLYPKIVRVKDQRRRWGSCSKTNGSINLNWKIVMSPLAVIDYIVVHELAHLEHPDHSRAFWAFVARYRPDYQACRRWLREHGGKLVL